MIANQKSFLYRVAECQLKAHANRISEVLYVFPNRRAGLFFLHYLGLAGKGALFSPEVMTEAEFFGRLSDYKQADPLRLLFKLYHIYTDVSGRNEPFDDFLYWGETMLADFNEIDQYSIDAHRLYKNISELKDLDAHPDEYLTSEQLEALRVFRSSLRIGSPVPYRDSFMDVWNILAEVYDRLTRVMQQEQCGYNGLLQKRALELLRSDVNPLRGRQIVFIGFNALTPNEMELFRLLQHLQQPEPDFYWDYEAPYIDKLQERGRLFTQNQKDFPSLHPIEPCQEDIEERGKAGRIHLYEMASTVGQTRAVGHILNQLFPPGSTAPQTDFTRTAVVLPDESLLQPLLHALPEQIDKVNVTMGYPLRATPVAGLMESLCELQLRKRTSTGRPVMFYHKTVISVLTHPYVEIISGNAARDIKTEILSRNRIYVPSDLFADDPLLACLFSAPDDAPGLIAYLTAVANMLRDRMHAPERQTEFRIDLEYLHHYLTLLNRLSDELAGPDTPGMLRMETCAGMLRRLVGGDNMAFRGEPLDGLQVMGMLETRGLDFEHLIITSMNEGIFPRHQSNRSFIPYQLRRGYGMSTHESQDAIFAYNFYRLIHHAQQIYFLTDTRTEEGQGGEQSRYLYQLTYQHNFPIERMVLSLPVHSDPSVPISVQKSAQVMEQLQAYLVTNGVSARQLSPSAINCYLDCKLKFYLNHVMRVKESDEVEEDMEANTIGSIFHEAMKELMRRYEGRVVTAADLREMLNDEMRLTLEVNRAFTHIYLRVNSDVHERPKDFPSADDSPVVTDRQVVQPQGRHRIMQEVLLELVRRTLRHDIELTPFTYISGEQQVSTQISFDQGRHRVGLHGSIDRIDQVQADSDSADQSAGGIRIIDYKTGTGRLIFSSMEQVFDATLENRPKYVLQTMLYALMCRQSGLTAPDAGLFPNIYYLRNLAADASTRLICKPDRNSPGKMVSYDDFVEQFRELLDRLLTELFNPEVPFTQTMHASVCRNPLTKAARCPFVDICRR